MPLAARALGVDIGWRTDSGTNRRVPGFVIGKISVFRRAGGGRRRAVPLECHSFLDGYSDYRDGRLEPEARSRLAGHIGACASCARYDRVIRQGVRVLRAEQPEVPALPSRVAAVRRQVRVEERRFRALGAAGSGMTLAASLIVTVLLTAAAWLPFLGLSAPEVEMPPVMAGAPAVPLTPLLFSLPRPFPAQPPRTAPVEIARSMLFEYGHTPARPVAREVETGLDQY